MTAQARLVSVLINNYNYGRFLRAAIDSALAQTYPHVEVVVVDDGSTDDSREIIGSYGDRVRPLLQSNGGQAAAVNAGLRMVRGDILFLLDSDDILAPDVAERAVAQFEADERCVRVQFRLATVDEAGNPTGDAVPPRGWPLLTGDLSTHVKRYRMFRSPPTSGNAWLTEAFRRLPPAPEDLRMYVDRWWSELSALLGTVGALDGIGGYYRLHGTSHHAQEGHGLDFFQTRIALTERLHVAGRDLAAREGVAGYPREVAASLDAALLTLRLAAHKLGDERRLPSLWRLAPRGVYAALVQPRQPWKTRIARAAWMLALSGTPSRSGFVPRLLAARYERGAH